MKTSSFLALATVALLAGALGSACNKQQDDAIEIDGVIAAKGGKSDVIASVWTCKATCVCDGGDKAVRYSSCAALDSEAERDGDDACARGCALAGLSAGYADSVSCEASATSCGYVPPLYPDLGSGEPVDLSYIYPEDTDFAVSYVDFASPNP